MKIKIFILVAVLSLTFSSISSAHPGRTDANGGHTCRTNCEKWGLQYGEYHYHNGGVGGGKSSNSSYSSSNNSTSASPKVTVTKEVVPSGQIKVALPTFNVVLNGKQINNSSSKYPVIVYKDITYFPMTWNYTQALGLDTNWDNNAGFSIRKSANPATTLKLDYGVSASKYAKLPEFNVFVNDSWLDNSKEEYPLLVLNDITYFPMTWKFAVDELGLTIKFENDVFYIAK